MQLAPFARFALASALIVGLAACGSSGGEGGAGTGSTGQGRGPSQAVAEASTGTDPAAGASADAARTGGASADPADRGDLPTAGASASAAVPPGPEVTTDDPPTEPPVAYARKVPMKGPVYVPTTFTGMHAHRWPGGSSPAPTYSYGTVRSLNYDPADNLGVLWYGIHKGDNVYDWSKMDQWVSTHYNAGKQLMYTLYGTPSYCASTSTKDPYNQPGGDSKPSSLTCVQKFIDALVRR